MRMIFERSITLHKAIKVLTTIILSASFFHMNVIPSEASEISFEDVSNNFWGYANIQWALINKLVDGYPDGTFKPNQYVTQNEFLAMLIRAYQPELDQETSNNTHWASQYVDYGLRMGWDITSTMGDTPIRRGTVAHIIANADGRPYNIENSIQHLLDTGISEGKTEKSVSGYKKDDNLTRTEALTFVQRLKQNLDTLKPIVPLEGITSIHSILSLNRIQPTLMYKFPSSEKDHVIGSLAPQNVEAFEEWNGWYHIKTWMGDAWISSSNVVGWEFHQTQREHAHYDFPFTISMGTNKNPSEPYSKGEQIEINVNITNSSDNPVTIVNPLEIEVRAIHDKTGVVWTTKTPVLQTTIPGNYGKMSTKMLWNQVSENGMMAPAGDYRFEIKVPVSIQYITKDNSLVTRNYNGSMMFMVEPFSIIE
jgi:hypothetical protein